MAIRFLLYGVLGWCVEIVFTALGRLREPGGWRLEGTTYLWMLPIYGLLAPLYEPLHDAMRGTVPLPARAVVYGAGFMAVEYACGWALRLALGACPWDYAGRARWHVQGVVRLDYAPLWMALGVLLEPVHDVLVRVTGVLLAG